MKDAEIDSLLHFIKKCTSPFGTVQTGKGMLLQAGFEELELSQAWELRHGGRYFAEIYGSTLFAFCIGKNMRHGSANALRIAAAHTDFPCLRIKPMPNMISGGYERLNVETYGGLIYSSWLDRPLSLAGKVMLRGKDAFSPRTVLLDVQRPVLTIPSLAIHMNREVNQGVAIDAQKELLPVIKLLGGGEDEKESSFLSFLASELSCEEEEILSYDMSVYAAEDGCAVGLDEAMCSSPRLDNLTSAKACLDALIHAKDAAWEGIRFCALFDNEEVGSQTKQGAGSAVLLHVLERIYASLGYFKENLLCDMAAGFMLSVDVAHAIHPNHVDKSDPKNQPVLGGGVVLKQSASQSYAGDAEAIAVVSELCRQHDIPFQRFVNRAGVRGGSTLGSIASAFLPIRTMDIGVPLLAMHSARETMGCKDQKALTDLLKAFYSEKLAGDEA